VHADPPALEYLADIHVDISAVHVAGSTLGTRLTYVISGGSITGPRLRGTVLPGGGDWVLLGSDGVARLDVRATVRTDDDVLLTLTNLGRVRMPAEVSERFLAGQPIRHDEMYGRSSPLFDTDDERYRWLTGLYTLAVNEVSLSTVDYRVFAVG
jgi:Protein of unknown function (DUF3237)